LRSRRIERLAGEALARRGWRLIHHDVRVAGVQIDLLARDPKGLLTVVEVKSNSPLVNLSWRQKRRLMCAAQVLAGREPVQLVFARVSGEDVLVLPVDGLTV
jgi:Holliday junction resolvase-like predicted endonuclease